jgi:tellurite resistance protein TerC
LRALYLVLATSLTRLRYLRFGLSAVLAFAGAKMLASTWIKLSPLTSVAVIATCITISIVASVIARRRADHAEASPLP